MPDRFRKRINNQQARPWNHHLTTAKTTMTCLDQNWYVFRIHVRKLYKFPPCMSVKVEIRSQSKEWGCSISRAGRIMKWDIASFTKWIYLSCKFKTFDHKFHNFTDFLISFINKTFVFAMKYILLWKSYPSLNQWVLDHQVLKWLVHEPCPSMWQHVISNSAIKWWRWQWK